MNDACRVERTFLTLGHEVVHAYLEVMCGRGVGQTKLKHGGDFSEILGLVQCKLSEGRCGLDLGQGGKYKIIWPGEGRKRDEEKCCAAM
jgi:hypothetical protein